MQSVPESKWPSGAISKKSKPWGHCKPDLVVCQQSQRHRLGASHFWRLTSMALIRPRPSGQGTYQRPSSWPHYGALIYIWWDLWPMGYHGKTKMNAIFSQFTQCLGTLNLLFSLIMLWPGDIRFSGMWRVPHPRQRYSERCINGADRPRYDSGLVWWNPPAPLSPDAGASGHRGMAVPVFLSHWISKHQKQQNKVSKYFKRFLAWKCGGHSIGVLSHLAIPFVGIDLILALQTDNTCREGKNQSTAKWSAFQVARGKSLELVWERSLGEPQIFCCLFAQVWSLASLFLLVGQPC